MRKKGGPMKVDAQAAIEARARSVAESAAHAGKGDLVQSMLERCHEMEEKIGCGV